MGPTQGDRSRRWRQTPRGQFAEQKRKARQRGIAFQLAFDTWWAIWQESGQWDKRGNRHGCFCMHRVGDQGAYRKGNVFIGPFAQNSIITFL